MKYQIFELVKLAFVHNSKPDGGRFSEKPKCHRRLRCVELSLLSQWLRPALRLCASPGALGQVTDQNNRPLTHIGTQHVNRALSRCRVIEAEQCVLRVKRASVAFFRSFL